MNRLLPILIITLIIMVPLFVVTFEFLRPLAKIWNHFTSALLPGYIKNTLLLLAGVGACTFFLGTGTACLVSMYRFPGRKFFAWALVMPIAIPAYINGYTWAGMLDYTSPLYTFLRVKFSVDTGAYLFFNFLSPKGVIIIFSLSLYPYVYLICRAFFLSQSAAILETASSMGCSPFQSFFRVVLPMARPAIVAGLSLVLMEVLNDYGLVHYFGVETFTTGIFSAWFSFGDSNTALRLAGWLMLFVFLIVIIEKLQRGKARFDVTGSGYRPIQRMKPGKGPAAVMMLICSLPFVLGFFLPFLTLFWWSIQTVSEVVDLSFIRLSVNSFLLAASASVTGITVALFILYSLRISGSEIMNFLAKAATLGYSLPGAVVAMGILIPLLLIDNWLGHIKTMITHSSAGLMISSSIFSLVYAYLVRFLAVGYNNLEAGYDRISTSIDESAASLGSTKRRTLRRIHLPLLKGALLAGGLLIFVDVLKELPLTLILRPFNFDTLAIRAYEYASDERIAQSAPAALIVILTGIIPAFLMNKMLTKPNIKT